MEDPTPPGGLRTQKVNLCALVLCLIQGGRLHDGFGGSGKHHSHFHLASTGECFTHSLHAREYIHSIHANSVTLEDDFCCFSACTKSVDKCLDL